MLFTWLSPRVNVTLMPYLALEGRDQRPHHLIDDQVGVVDDLAFLLGLGDQVGADVGGGGGGGAHEGGASATMKLTRNRDWCS